MNLRKQINRIFSFGAFLFILPGCDFIEGLIGKEPLEYSFHSSDSLSSPEIIGTVTDGDDVDSDLRIIYFSVSPSGIDFLLESSGLIPMKFFIPSKNGVFPIVKQAQYDQDDIMIYGNGYSFYIKSGSGTVSDYKVDVLDYTRGEVSFRFKASGPFGDDSSPWLDDRTISFDFTVKFENRNDPPYTPPVAGGGSGSSGGSSGGGSGGGGSTVSYCTTTYQGPKGAPQRDGFCESAWLYLCKNGYAPDSKEVKAYCKLYAQMNQITTPMQNCPYCK